MALRDLYCARGQAENLIKLHKAQLASDRTSCRAATANQLRLILHTAAYWLMLAVRDAIPRPALAIAEFATIRLRLFKSPPASSRPPPASGSPSPPPAPRPLCSAIRRVQSGPARRKQRGVRSLKTRSHSPTRSSSSSPRRGEKHAAKNRDRIHAAARQLPKSKPSLGAERYFGMTPMRIRTLFMAVAFWQPCSWLLWRAPRRPAPSSLAPTTPSLTTKRHAESDRAGVQSQLNYGVLRSSVLVLCVPSTARLGLQLLRLQQLLYLYGGAYYYVASHVGIWPNIFLLRGLYVLTRLVRV